LYFGLSVIPIRLPALPERDEDIAAISWHLLAVLNLRYGKKVSEVVPVCFAV
jgi:transcriptional regulator with PAS, ATPase and Fis domain